MSGNYLFCFADEEALFVGWIWVLSLLFLESFCHKKYSSQVHFFSYPWVWCIVVFFFFLLLFYKDSSSYSSSSFGLLFVWVFLKFSLSLKLLSFLFSCCSEVVCLTLSFWTVDLRTILTLRKEILNAISLQFFFLWVWAWWTKTDTVLGAAAKARARWRLWFWWEASGQGSDLSLWVYPSLWWTLPTSLWFCTRWRTHQQFAFLSKTLPTTKWSGEDRYKS